MLGFSEEPLPAILVDRVQFPKGTKVLTSLFLQNIHQIDIPWAYAATNTLCGKITTVTHVSLSDYCIMLWLSSFLNVLILLFAFPTFLYLSCISLWCTPTAPPSSLPFLNTVSSQSHPHTPLWPSANALSSIFPSFPFSGLFSFFMYLCYSYILDFPFLLSTSGQSLILVFFSIFLYFSCFSL